MAVTDITAPDGSKLNIDYLKADGSIVLTTNWDAGNYEIRSRTFRSDIPTGTAPFNVASTTIVTNLNAALLNGNLSTAFLGASATAIDSDKVDGYHAIALCKIGSSYPQSNNVYFNSGYGARYGASSYLAFFSSGTAQLSTNLYIVSDCSALTFTDRTPFYEGDALAEIKNIKGNGKGEIDHTSLPAIARRKIKYIKLEEEVEEDGRDLGAMISILTVAVQQLTERIEQLESKI